MCPIAHKKFRQNIIIFQCKALASLWKLCDGIIGFEIIGCLHLLNRRKLIISNGARLSDGNHSDELLCWAPRCDIIGRLLHRRDAITLLMKSDKSWQRIRTNPNHTIRQILTIPKKEPLVIASHNYHVQTNTRSSVLFKIPNWTFEINDIIVLGNAQARDMSGNYVLLDFARW